MRVNVFRLDCCFGEFADQDAADGLTYAFDLADAGAEK